MSSYNNELYDGLTPSPDTSLTTDTTNQPAENEEFVTHVSPADDQTSEPESDRFVAPDSEREFEYKQPVSYDPYPDDGGAEPSYSKMSEDVTYEEEKYEDDIVTDEDQPDAESAPMGGAIVPVKQAEKKNVVKKSDEETSSALTPVLTHDGSISTIHTSYIQHIRQLQKTNAALGKKVEYLNAIQNENTRMKLIKKLQRVLREKQIMIDDLAELILQRNVMTPDELTAHLQKLIEAGALEQSNPAKLKKEIQEARKENVRLLNELREARRTIRSFESASTAPTTNGSTSNRSATASKTRPNPISDAPISSTADLAQAQAQLDAATTKHDQLTKEFLELSQQHIALQTAHHALSISLTEHKKLIETITSENRTLRGYLTQWESSEERRILAEQTNLGLVEEKKRWIAEQESLYQEMRAMKSKLQVLVQAKVDIQIEANKKVIVEKNKTAEANEHVAHVERQLTLLKRDLKQAHEMVAYQRGQNVLHLSALEKQTTEELESQHKEQVKTLEKEIQTWKKKYELLLAPVDSNTSKSTTKTILNENTRLSQLLSVLERKLGSALTQVDTVTIEKEELVTTKKQADQELSVLQTALRQMARDLQTLQKTSSEREKQVEELLTRKLPKMRAQRTNLAQACQRQNVTIRELNKELERMKETERKLREQFGAPSTSYTPVASTQPLSSRPGSSSGNRPSSSLSQTSNSIQQVPNSPSNSSRANAISSQSAASLPPLAASPRTAKEKRPSSARTNSIEPSPKSSPRSYATTTATIQPDLSTQPTFSPNQSPSDAPSSVHDAYSLAFDTAVAAASPVTTAVSSPYVTASSSPRVESEWSDPSGIWTRYPTDDGLAYFYYNNQTEESVWIDPLLDAATAATAATSSSPSMAAPTTISTGVTIAPLNLAAVTATSSSSAQVRDTDLQLTPLVSSHLKDLPQLSTRGDSGEGSSPGTQLPADSTPGAPNAAAVGVYENAIDEFPPPGESNSNTTLSSHATASSAPVSTNLPPIIARLPTAGHVTTEEIPDEEFPVESGEIEESF